MPESAPSWLQRLAHEVQREWETVVDALDWETAPRAVWEPPPAPGSPGTWCPGGSIDVARNLVHRHAEAHGDRVAIRWEGEPGDRSSLTYAQLSHEVDRAVRALRGLGVGSQDVVALHTGWLPETVVTMIACMSIGASWSMLPVSLPSEALGLRIEQLAPTVLLTQDGAWRRGAVLPLKARADEALASTSSVETTVVIRRTGMDVAWFHGDVWYSDLLDSTDPLAPVASTALPPDHVLCTRQQASGAPTARLTQHTVAGVLLQSAAVHATVRSGPVFWCAADVSWAVSTWHGLIGPLLSGDTVVVYEGTLDVPDHQRTLDIVERYGVSTLVTSPSVMRTLRDWRIEESIAARGASLTRLMTAGEPVEPGLRDWMERTFAAVDCAIADGWGQVELTGIVLVTGTSPRLDSARVVAHALPRDALGHDDRPADKPAADTQAWGTHTADGSSAQGSTAARRPVGPGGSGQVVLQLPTPGSINLTEHLDRAWETGAAEALVVTEDVVAIDPDGTPHFRGRADGVVSVSGQLISLSAVERALEEHPFVTRALALRAHRENSGSTIVACVVIDGEPSDAVARDLIATVNAELGGLARPRMIVFVDRVAPPLERTVLAQALTSLIPSRTVWTARGWDEIRAAVRTTRSD